MSDTPEPTAETAFLVVKTLDGLWQIQGDISTIPVIQRTPTRLDVKIGCSEMEQTIINQDIANMVAETLASYIQASPPTES